MIFILFLKINQHEEPEESHDKSLDNVSAMDSIRNEISKMTKIYFITGASGVGKTTLIEQLDKKYNNKRWSFLHFDSIGVPSVEDMIKEYGSPSGWQEAITYQCIHGLPD